MKQKQIIEWSITEIVVSDPCLTPAGTGLILFTGAFKLKGDLSNNAMHFDSEGITQGVPDHLHATALRELAGMIEQTIKLYNPMISFLNARHLPEANRRTGGKKTKTH